MSDRTLAPTGRRARLAASAAAGCLLLLGSARGNDGDFPFGPFRMFATSGRTTGAVRVAVLVGVTDGGETIEVTPDAIGIRRAELEGRYGQFRADPALLGALAGDYERRHGVRLREVTLEQRVHRVVDRHVQREEERRVVARWQR